MENTDIIIGIVITIVIIGLVIFFAKKPKEPKQVHVLECTTVDEDKLEDHCAKMEMAQSDHLIYCKDKYRETILQPAIFEKQFRVYIDPKLLDILYNYTAMTRPGISKTMMINNIIRHHINLHKDIMLDIAEEANQKFMNHGSDILSVN